NLKSNLGGNANNSGTSNSRPNNFMSSQNNPQARSYSTGNDPEKKSNINSGSNSNPNSNSGETKIIIASKFKNVVHNSYNNIFIQSTDDLEKIYSNNSSGNNPTNSNYDGNSRT